MVLKGGSPAIHKLGNLSRSDDDYIRVNSETDDLYIGSFEEGFGFINVEFNKQDCRNLTQEEIDKFNNSWYTISGNPISKYRLDSDGNIAPWTAEELKNMTPQFVEKEIVIAVDSFGITVEIDITDTFRGEKWNKEPQKGYKRIPTEELDKYIQRMKVCVD